MKKYAILITVCMILSALCLTVGAEDVLLMENKCEDVIENVTVMEGAPDKSKYYKIEGGIDIGHLPYETSSDFVYELDIRFNNEGSGFSLMKKGKWNSCIRVKDGNFALQTGGNNFTKYTPIELDKWYHFTFVGRTNRDANQVTYGHIILEEYQGGERVNKKVFKNVNLRNNAATHYINVFGGCDIDNLKAYEPAPTRIELTSDGEEIIAGGGVKFTAKAFYGDLEMHGVNSGTVEYAVFDETNTYAIDDEGVSITPEGELKTSPLTAPCTVTVRVTSKVSGMSESKKVKIISGDLFTVKGVGISSDKSKITKIKVNKNFASYKDGVTFVVTFSNRDAAMYDLAIKSMYAENIAEGENEIAMSIDIPEGFDWENSKIKVFVVTTLTGADVNSIIKLKKEEIEKSDSFMTVVTIKEDADISKVKREDILYFDVVSPGEDTMIPEGGKTYVMGSRNKIDTLFEIIK